MGEFSLALEGARAGAADARLTGGKPETRARALVNDHFDFVWRLLRRLGLEELSAPEVASIVAAPVGTVASRLRRARQTFTLELERLKARGK